MLERGAPNSVCLVETGKVLPDVGVAIVHPDTKAPCAHTDLGEVLYRHINCSLHAYASVLVVIRLPLRQYICYRLIQVPPEQLFCNLGNQGFIQLCNS